MKFVLVVNIRKRNIRLQVERIYLSSQIEKFEITARNKFLTIQSNRPLLKAKGLKYRKPDYKLIAGVIQAAGVTHIIDRLHDYIIRAERNEK